MNKYDKLFLEQAMLGYKNFSWKYGGKAKHDDLFRRKHQLNKKFVFSEANIKRLSEINSLLAEKEVTVYQQSEKLENYVLNLKQNQDPFVTDYEIEFNISFFAEKKYAHIPDLEGNPFFDYDPLLFSKTEGKSESEIIQHKEWIFNVDHTEYIREGHPLYSFRHCWLFHDLIDHTILSYQDIVDIEDMWIDVNLIVQNATKLSD
jgi:hypothetical protein